MFIMTTIQFKLFDHRHRETEKESHVLLRESIRSPLIADGESFLYSHRSNRQMRYFHLKHTIEIQDI